MVETTTFDPAQYKADLRTEWRNAAPGWRAWLEVLEAADGGQALSRSLVQLARIGPGDSVLDVAAGYGEPGLTAARAVAPGGHVVCTDISAEMLAVGRSARLRRDSTTSSSSSSTPRSWRSRRPVSMRC
jgi:SAM-dependent methyltransferase